MCWSDLSAARKLVKRRYGKCPVRVMRYFGESAAKGKSVLIPMNAQPYWEMPARPTPTKLQVGMPTSLETCQGIEQLESI